MFKTALRFFGTRKLSLLFLLIGLAIGTACFAIGEQQSANHQNFKILFSIPTALLLTLVTFYAISFLARYVGGGHDKDTRI